MSPHLRSEVENLAAVNFQPIHAAAVAATLKTQWDALKQADEAARLLFRVAGQFAEAAAIPTDLGLFAGVSHVDDPVNPSPLRRALKRLHDVRLVEDLHEDRVRLHPLVREFAAALTPPGETQEFRHDCARRVVQTFEDFTTLEDDHPGRRGGRDPTMLSCRPGLRLRERTTVFEAISSMLRVFRRESHHLREWDRGSAELLRPASPVSGRDPGGVVLGRPGRRRLNELARPALVAPLADVSESPALVRILTGH